MNYLKRLNKVRSVEITYSAFSIIASALMVIASASFFYLVYLLFFWLMQIFITVYQFSTPLTWTYISRSQRSWKGQAWTNPRFWTQKHCGRVWKWLWHSLRSYVHKQSWPWPILQGHTGHRIVNINLVQDLDPRSF